MNGTPRTGLVLYTHGAIGAALLSEARHIIDGEPRAVRAVEARGEDDELVLALDAMELGGGVLVLTDLQGASPANRALHVAQSVPACRVVAGLNLPMLLRVLNYRGEPLDALAQIAVDGGARGVTALD